MLYDGSGSGPRRNKSGCAVPSLGELKIMDAECHVGKWVRSGTKQFKAPLPSGGPCILQWRHHAVGRSCSELDAPGHFPTSNLSLLIPAENLEPGDHQLEDPCVIEEASSFTYETG